MDILIKGKRIEDVSISGSHLPPQGAQVVDLTGKTVLPGLIDTHVHVSELGDEGLSLFIAAGVTTVRDCGGRLETLNNIRDEINSGAKVGPRMDICGPLIDGAEKSFDYSWAPGSAVSVPSAEEVPAIIDPILNAGSDWLKFYFTMTADIATEIIRHVDGRVPTTGHLGYMTSMEAIQAGINGIEHMAISPYNDLCAADMRFGQGASMQDGKWWPLVLNGWNTADLDSDGAKRWYDAMAEKQVGMGTTLSLLYVARDGLEVANKDPERRLIPEKLLTFQKLMADHHNDLSCWDIKPALPGVELVDYSGKARQALEKHQDCTRRLHEAGGLIVGGTDSGAYPFPPPGFALLREIELLAEAIGNLEAIRSVTSEAARYLRRHNELGSIRSGFLADLLIINGNPLENIETLRNATAVYKDGVLFSPEKILSGIPVAYQEIRPDLPSAELI
jgi:hypothetical protein